MPPGSLKLYPRPFERNTRRKQLERVRITPFQFVSFSDVFAESRVSVMSALVLVFVCRVFGLWFKFMRNSVTRFRVGEAIYIYITDFGFGIGEEQTNATLIYVQSELMNDTWSTNVSCQLLHGLNVLT